MISGLDAAAVLVARIAAQAERAIDAAGKSHA
jgi:hypothetical protein